MPITITEKQFRANTVLKKMVEPITTYLIDRYGYNKEDMDGLTLEDLQEWYDEDKAAILEYNKIYIKD